MKNLLRISFKNVVKSRERTVLTFLILAFGAAVYVWVYGLLGALLNLSSNEVRSTETADIRVRVQAFDEENPFSQTNLFPASEEAFIKGGYSFTPRLFLPAEADNFQDVLPVTLIAVDPLKDKTVFDVKTSVSGPLSQGLAWVGSALARDLKLEEGDLINITFQTLDINGESASRALEYTVGALISSANPLFSERGVMVDLNEVQQLLGTNVVSFYSILLSNENALKENAAALKEALPHREVLTWIDLTKEERDNILVRKQFMGGFILLIVLITLMGLVNTILISVWEKRKTTGTLRALGYADKEIMLLFVFEGFWIGFLGALIGVGLGVLGTIPMVAHGFNIEPFLKIGGETINMGFYVPPVLKGQWDGGAILTPLIFMPLAAMGVSVFPARRSVKMSIVDCLRNKD